MLLAQKESSICKILNGYPYPNFLLVSIALSDMNKILAQGVKSLSMARWNNLK